MTDLDLAAVAAAGEAWVSAPKGTELVAETDEFRIVRLPEGFPDPLQVQWVRTARPSAKVLDDIVAATAGLGLPEANFHVRLRAPGDLVDALVARGAEHVVTTDVLARPLPGETASPDETKTPGTPGLEVRWRTTVATTRDANIVGTTVFGGTRASDELIARRAASGLANYESGEGGAVVAYVDGSPAGVGGLELVDGVARLWGGGVIEEYRGRGVYQAMIAARLAYAAERGARMALTLAVQSTSSPILRRLGFVSYGNEHAYRLPLP